MTRGRTPLGSSGDTRTVYVSTFGSDGNDGLSDLKPKRTIAAAAGLIRPSCPDHLLFNRGETWNEGIGQWKKSGRSEAEPMLLSTYGSAIERPLFQTGSGVGIWTGGGGGSPATIDNLAIVGLHFAGRDENGGAFLQPSTNLLVEDCMFSGYARNLVFQGEGGRHKNIRLRRSVIVDAGASDEHSQGLYAYGVDGLVIEGCCFDHNGYPATIFNHGLYIDNGNTGVIVSENIIAGSSSHGMQLRCGGSVIDNLFVRNSIALSIGGGNAPESDGVVCNVRGNVILDGKNINDANPRGWGMWFANIAGGVVERNVIANNGTGAQPQALTLDGNHEGSHGIHRLTFRGNRWHNWPTVLSDGDVDVTFLDNDPVGDYPAPRRSPATYNAHVGGAGTYEAFIAGARAQMTTMWRRQYTAPEVNAWIRAGFGVSYP